MRALAYHISQKYKRMGDCQ